jgi:hypothetical protein
LIIPTQFARLPEDYRSDPGLSQLLGSLHLPHEAISVNIGRDVGDLPKIMEDRQEKLEKLEVVLAKYLKGGKVGPKRPLLRLGGW